MNLSDAIDHYHSLLRGTRTADAIEKLRAGTQQFNLAFGTRPICSVLRPMLIDAARYDYVLRESTLVLSAMQRLGAVLLRDARLRAELSLSSLEEQIIQIEPGFAAPDASGRLDAFLDSRSDFSFVEYNADSPGGLLYGDVLGDIFAEMDVVREFAQTYPVRRVPIRPRLLDALLDAYRQWGGRDRPRIAIVDWKEAQTRAEFELARDYFVSRGYPTVIVDPAELEYRGGWLRANGQQINLVYKRLLTGELLEKLGLNHPLVRAAKDRAACVVNSFRVQMLFKKALFALLDDPANEHLFSADETAALRRHIPWTRILRAGHTSYHGRKIDLLEFVAANQEKLTIKPNGDYGGRGVVLGWECDREKWQACVRDALGAPFVVQERVEVMEQSFPAFIDGEVKFLRYYVDFDPYTWGGEQVAGAGVRLSQTALLNVSAGGGSATPMLILETL